MSRQVVSEVGPSNSTGLTRLVVTIIWYAADLCINLSVEERMQQILGVLSAKVNEFELTTYPEEEKKRKKRKKIQSG